MEKKDNNMMGSGDVDHTSRSYHEEYSELLEVPVKYLRRQQTSVKLEQGKDKDKDKIELEEIKFEMWMEKFCESESDELDQEKSNVVEAIKARLVNLHDTFNTEALCFLALLWATTMKTQRDAQAKCQQVIYSLKSTQKLFCSDEEDDNDIPVLIDLASTQLEKIKVFNSKTIASLEAENLNETTLQDISNHYLSFYKGIMSLHLKIDLLRFHLKHRRRDLKDLVDRFLASVEVEVGLYKEELDTTRFKVFELVKKKTQSFGLGWLPDNWKGTFLSIGIKSFILCARLIRVWIERNNKLLNIRSIDKEKAL